MATKTKKRSITRGSRRARSFSKASKTGLPEFTAVKAIKKVLGSLDAKERSMVVGYLWAEDRVNNGSKAIKNQIFGRHSNLAVGSY